MRILLIHQFLWSHYKAGIFQELENIVKGKPADTLHIIQTAKYEKSRLDFGEADTSIHTYEYELLFDDVYENTSYFDRVKQVFKRLRLIKPTVITLPGYYEPAMVTIHFIAKMMRIKVVLAVDSTESDNPNKWYAELIKKFIVYFADGFFCYGKKSADYMLKLGAPQSKILMRRNSVNNNLVADIHRKHKASAEFKEERKSYPKYNFIFVGRFLDIKNLNRLIQSFKNLERSDDWGLILVGDGPLKKEILEKYHNLKGLFILPPQEWHGVPKKLALADILVLPSYSEPWGLVTNEAMVCQMPVIASEQSGSSADLVRNNENGFVFDAYSEKELKGAMQFFVDQPEKILEYGKKSKEMIANFSPENVAHEMYQGYLKLHTD
ncbi:glycosyltransferase family 4 protein [Arcticibacterium luteifluviistationis]|uniref:Glycosyltransferase family 1 protein n=1 Tax=Arcticibacterium luteifluviistationis TaxID=1784714 RepID=A0A2Z4GC30_9BACT|nr:glycosyltransferase family 4 protein [Arcticibacterium luteifluviistationis]AWV98605.1 glycosyltransferase family 1 protein [Arcticibacterium luteifluviistationis]